MKAGKTRDLIESSRSGPAAVNLVESVFAAAGRLDRWSRPALVCDARPVTYAELLSMARRFGGALRALDVGGGERVAIVARDGPEFVAAFLGSAAVGAVAVPLSTMLSATELEYVLGHCGAKAVVVTADQEAKLDGVRASLRELKAVIRVDGEGEEDFRETLERAPEAEIQPVEGDALAFILYTSGSTGRHKGAMHRHGDIAYTVETYARHVLGLVPEDRVFSSSRLFFAYGLGNSLSFPLSAGATAILCRERPTPSVIGRIFESERPTVFFGVPAVYGALIAALERGETLPTSSLRVCVSAGEMLPERIHLDFRKRTGLDILDGIGSTELLHIFISNTNGQVRPGSSGRVVPGYEAKLVDPVGVEVEGAGSGNLLVKGASASPGYWMDARKTAETMEKGWVRTGDVYRRDETGTYWFEGRSDDLFKVKGLWVSPVEVEDALMSCPGVNEAAVVAGLTGDGTTLPVAYVVLGQGAPEEKTLEAISSRLHERLPHYKCPVRIHTLPEMPRTATGKLQRYVLRGRTID